MSLRDIRAARPLPFAEPLSEAALSSFVFTRSAPSETSPQSPTSPNPLRPSALGKQPSKSAKSQLQTRRPTISPCAHFPLDRVRPVAHLRTLPQPVRFKI